ncbi:GNAT family N-acetyltransferase [Frigidibacter sp. MR17.14]|uniref:GNAT family N-acetyltransferase n=1 Tax=Frigidibacter sp. MR17.14 TaxID=3126509 RepID=UPI0030130012
MSPGAAPRLETPRLVLRALVAADFDDYAALWSDPEVTAHVGGTRDADRSWSSFLLCAGFWPLFGHGIWAVTRREDGGFLGHIGFMRARRGLHGLDEVPECGWMLQRKAQGLGYGREAAEAVHRWYDAAGFGRSFVMIEPRHAGSIRLAKGLGYRHLRDDRFGGDAVVLLARD